MGVISAVGTYDSCCVSAAVSLAASDTVIAYITFDHRPNIHQCQAGMERSTVHLCSWNWWSNYCYYYYYQYAVGFCPTVLCSTRSDTVISKHCRRQSARRTPPVSVSVCVDLSLCRSVVRPSSRHCCCRTRQWDPSISTDRASREVTAIGGVRPSLSTLSLNLLTFHFYLFACVRVMIIAHLGLKVNDIGSGLG